MWWTKFIQKFFLIPEILTSEKEKTIKDLDFCDTVWIKDEDGLFEGWVFDITRRCVVVIYDKGWRDFRFRIEKPLNRTEIEQSGKVLYCNEPKITD